MIISLKDAHGSMGLTTEGNKKLPVQVVPEVIAADIASGNDHLVILTRNGSVYTIGCAEQGQLGRITSRTLTGESRRGKKSLLTPGLVPLKAGKFIATEIWTTPFCTFLRERNTERIYGFGLNNYNQLGVAKSGKEFEHFPVMSSFTNVKSITGGLHHTIVLTNDNKVHAIGRKDYGRLGLGDVSADVEKLTLINSLSKHDIVDVACGESNSFAITKNGQVYVWGMGTNSQLGTGDDDDVPEPKLLVSTQLKDKNILSVNSGGQHSLFTVEVPAAAAEKPAKAPTAKSAPSTTEVPQSTIVKPIKAATKENGNPAKATDRQDVNGNSEKDEKMEIDETAPKRARKRKA